MLKHFPLQRLVILFGVFALLFSIFLVISDEPTVHSDDPAGTVIESDDSQVTQQGSWTSQSANGASGGSYLYSSGDEDDALILPFQGSRIEILYVKNPSLGDFAIEIDNTIRRTVVTTSKETSFGNSAVVDYLEDGPHVVKIFAVEGTIAIDAFIGTPFTVQSRSENSPFTLAPQRAGEIEAFNQEFRTENDSQTVTIHEPGASFIKVHFAEMDLGDGDTLTVSNTDGTQVHTYPGAGVTTDGEPGVWALSVIGDTAIIQTNSQTGNPDVASGNVRIDKYVRGYSESELLVNNGAEESTCGSNQRTDAVCYSGSNPTEFANSNPVARLIITNTQGVFNCTGWRISAGNYMLTNEHCITNQTDVNGTEVQFNYQRNVCGSGVANTPTTVTGSTFLTDNYNLDFALFSVNSFASISSFGHLDPDVRTPVLGEQIYIPQHGAGNPKEFGIASDLNTGSVCRIDDAIFDGRAANTDTGYYCDTTGGSSGSPVLATSSHRVVALHHFGIIGSTCTSTDMNSGVRMDLIYPFITSYFDAYKPTTPTLTTPSGAITNTNPTYTWNAQANATAYKLVVNNPSATTIIETWYSPSTVGCGAGTGTCSVIPATSLSNGAHQWWIEAWSPYASAWSTAGNFTVNVGVPAVISKISPVGDVSTNPPSFSWTADANATNYHLVVTGPSATTIIDEWYTATNAGCPGGTGTCTVTPSVVQQGGAHQWWVHGSGPGGTGPWGSPTNFNQTNGTAAPQIITTISPTGDTADNTPTYTWNADTWAEWYYLYVMKGSTVVMNTWYSKTDAGCAGGTGTCSITPTTVLSSGAHKWFIVGWNSLGTGPWSTQTDFNVTVGPPTTPTTLVSPIGGTSTADRTPTFTWNAHVDANQYYLYINGPSGVVLSQTFTSAAVGCATTCSYTPTNPLLSTKGSHSWWVQVINDYGAGPWSSTGTFNYNPPAPGTVTLNGPTGLQNVNPPTFNWNADPNATWYYLYVDNGTSPVFTQWYSATNAGCPSGTGNCEVTPSSGLATSFNYRWWIQTYNDSGSAWTGPQSFTMGFNSQFQNSATGWVAHTGTWSFDSEYLYTNPSTTDLSTASNSNTWINFDYQARIQRTGCATCANMVVVRGTPGSAPTNPGNNWDSGYRFQITRDGRYSVFRLDSATGVQLQGWTASAAINQGDAWNTLRVVGNGSNFSFYINGTLVWSGSDATYGSGRVGVGMYRSSGDTNDEISVDWATLTVPAASASPSPESSISPTQRALNEAANSAENTGNANNAPAIESSSQAESSAAPPRRGPGTELPRE